MDQGTSDPNNPNPSMPQPASAGPMPAEPVAPPSNFGMAAPSPVDQSNPMPPPSTPVEAPVSAPSAGEPSWNNPAPAAVSSTQPVATLGSTPPTAFNPFSSPASEEPVSAAPSAGTETVPTDLSSLAGNSSEAVNYVPQASDASANMGTTMPESLVVAPSTPVEGVQAVTSTGGGGFPKIIYIVGGIVLLVVIAASAYFIFGVGKPAAPEPTSIPAVQKPIATPTPTAVIPTSTSSTGLPGSTSTGSATPAVGSSAYQLLLQQRTSTKSAR